MTWKMAKRVRETRMRSRTLSKAPKKCESFSDRGPGIGTQKSRLRDQGLEDRVSSENGSGTEALVKMGKEHGKKSRKEIPKRKPGKIPNRIPAKSRIASPQESGLSRNETMGMLETRLRCLKGAQKTRLRKPEKPCRKTTRETSERNQKKRYSKKNASMW